MRVNRATGVRAVRVLHQVEDLLLALLLTAMIALACTQILLRNFFEFSLLWVDPLLRVMVLWLGLLGAVVASRNNRHISVDLLVRLVRGVQRRALVTVNALFTSAVCALVAVHGARLVQFEYLDQTRAFAGVPVWALEIIIPVSFAAIALRYALYAAAQWWTGGTHLGE